jgi:hypothetical protein
MNSPLAAAEQARGAARCGPNSRAAGQQLQAQPGGTGVGPVTEVVQLLQRRRALPSSRRWVAGPLTPRPPRSRPPHPAAALR